MGNDNADRFAKEAAVSNCTPRNIQIASDLKTSIKKLVRNYWQNYWNQSSTFLHQIDQTIERFVIPGITRNEMVVARRLRIGHTRFTHGHLMNSTPKPICHYCQSPLSVLHILVDCPHSNKRRQELGMKDDITDILSKQSQVITAIQFLKLENLLNNI